MPKYDRNTKSFREWMKITVKGQLSRCTDDVKDRELWRDINLGAAPIDIKKEIFKRCRIQRDMKLKRRTRNAKRSRTKHRNSKKKV